MTRLQVETDDFVDASRSMFHEVAESMRICLDGVQFRSELVGTDPAGEQWAAAYDPAARSVLRATAQTIDAAFTTARLLAQSGHNYAAAEAASTTSRSTAGSGVPDAAEWAQLLAPQPRCRVPVPPSAGGAGGDTPTGWWLVEHTLGYLWPGGHQDKLHATAHQWRSLADGISHVTGDLLAIAARFAADHLPEADDIITVCTTLRTHTDTLLDGYTQLADACDAYAEHLTDCHNAVIDELTDLLRDSALIQGAGAVFAVFTLGGSEAAAQTGQAARIAAAATRITSLIERLIAAASRVAQTISTVRNLADNVVETLAALAAARLAYAGVKQVGRLAVLARLGRRAGPMLRAEREAAAMAARARERMHHIGDPRKFNPSDLRGLSRDGIAKHIPADWARRPVKDGRGTIYTDPHNRGRQIRIMDGYPPSARPGVITHGPYAVVSQNGKTQKIPLEGNPAL